MQSLFEDLQKFISTKPNSFFFIYNYNPGEDKKKKKKALVLSLSDIYTSP